jgi:hypothetical protein
MVGCRIGRNGRGGHVQVPADDLSDVPERYALVADPMIPDLLGPFSRARRKRVAASSLCTAGQR